MTPGLKRSAWLAVALGVGAVIAYPKVRPLLNGSKSVTRSATESANGKKGREAAGAGALRVSAVTVRPAPFAETLVSTGTLRAEEGIELQAEVSGKVVAINFREGSRVKKGDLLVKINDAELRATLSRAESRRSLAGLKEGRFATLLKNSGVKQEDYDIAANEVLVQKAEVELIEAQIAKTEIRAPFDGVVGLRFVSEGSFIVATANSTVRIATLQSLDNLKIDFSLPEKYASRLRPGSAFSFTVSGGDYRFLGEVYAMDPRIDLATRTVLVRGVCPNPQTRLLPGAFAQVALPLAPIDGAILVPAVAVIPGLSDKNVFVVEEGRAVRRPVDTGMRTESSVQILSGLKAGDVVITSGIQQLRSGIPVVASVDVAKPGEGNAVRSSDARPVAKPRERSNAAPVSD